MYDFTGYDRVLNAPWLMERFRDRYVDRKRLRQVGLMWNSLLPQYEPRCLPTEEIAQLGIPRDKKVFFFATYGGSNGTKAIEEAVREKDARIVGSFGCKGYDTFGPFKLVGGIAKGHPDETDLKNACQFLDGLLNAAQKEN